MDDLISLAQTLQQASSALVGDDIPEEGQKDDAPVLQVVVVGATGVGKSAVLNTLIGNVVLPTAEGGATRFPVLIDMQNDKNLPAGVIRGNLGPRTNMSTPTEIREAILADMKRWKPSSRTREEALLTLRSAIAPPLRIIDLPGVEARASDLDSLIQDNTTNNDSILLVVLSAKTIKDSLRVLRLAHDIDRDGTRTVGVVTMLDAVTDSKASVQAAVELLQGQGSAMAQSYPWVCVVGQPVGDKDSNAPLDRAWQEEIRMLGTVMRSSGHKGLEPHLGRDALLKLLARTVRQKMKEKIPRIMAGLEGRSQEVDSELLRLGESLISSLEGSRAVALELCRGFETKFIEHLEGGEGEGGSQMVEKFVGVLPLRFRALPLDDLFSVENVKKVVTEADGYQPYLMSPEKGLKLLIKRCLELAKQPGLDTVDEVHKILLDIVSAAGNTAPSLVRFPPMKRELVSIASSALDLYRAEAKTMITALVDMERVFVPPAHFIEAEYDRQIQVWKELEVARKSMQDRMGSSSRRASESSGDEKQPGRLASTMRLLTRKDAPPPPPPVPNAPLQELAGFLWKISSKGGWSKRWFALSDKTSRLYYVKKPDEKTPRGVIPLDDCVIDDVVAPEECPPASDAAKGVNATPVNALSFKITNRVPYKTVVKVHHSLVLRADNLAEKNQWVMRLRMHSKATKEGATGKEGEAKEEKAEGDSSSAEGEGGKSLKDAKEEAEAGGSGTGIPSVPGVAPAVRRASDPEEELKYMAGEVKRYVKAVLAHLAENIPKAIVLTQVERSKDAMLTKLYQAISALSDDRIHGLLEEDVESKGKRERFRRMQESLVKLKRALSLHEARASAEEYSQGEGDAQDDWRKAFNKASITPILEDTVSPKPTSKQAQAKDSQPQQQPRSGSGSGSTSSSRGALGGGGTAAAAPPPAAAPATPPTMSRSSTEAAPTQPPSSGGGGYFRAGSLVAGVRGQSPLPNGAPTDAPPMGPPIGASRRRVPPPPPATTVYKYP